MKLFIIDLKEYNCKIMNIFNKVKDKIMASIGVKPGSVIVVNGKTYHGNNVSVINDSVYIDGVLQDTPNGKTINIVINGDATEVSTASGDVIIKGSVEQSVTTASGDVEVSGRVGRDVSTTSGDVYAKHVEGSIRTVSGDISKL